jgi:hypothetical protein
VGLIVAGVDVLFLVLSWSMATRAVVATTVTTQQPTADYEQHDTDDRDDPEHHQTSGPPARSAGNRRHPYF